MRGFSTIEILIALVIATTSIVAATLIAFGTPAVLENARLEYAAYGIADALLTAAELEARSDFGLLVPVATTSDGIYERSLSLTYLQEGLAARLTSRTAWIDTYGRRQQVALVSTVADPEAARDESCSPIPSGNWHAPRILANYRLSHDDLLPNAVGKYPPASLAMTRDRLAVAVDPTTLPTDPSLFLFSTGSMDDRPELMGSFDNASTSRSGFAEIAMGGGYLYAANGFGSASPTTCATGACAQLSIFALEERLEPVGKITLAGNAPPYALSSGNMSTPAKSIAYRKGFVYLGLEKTLGGNELNIIDVRDPARPAWVGGVAVGRSVSDIGIQGGYAYLATSDPARELIVVDVTDPAAPRIIGNWNAPGATNFGLGNVIVARMPRLYFGRTYVGNAPEFFVLDAADPAHPAPLHEDDTGSLLRPESVRGIVVRDFLVAILSGKRLELWDAGENAFEKYADFIDLPGTGTSLACRGNTLYAGSIDADGDGILTLLTGS